MSLCADPACARPVPRPVARLEATAYLPKASPLAVASGPGDRPVAARFDIITGQIHVVSCLDPDCREARVTTPVPPYLRRDDAGSLLETGLALAVRADGRPVIAYRDLRDRAAKLLDCRTPDCAEADVVPLAAGAPYLPTPALVLDRAGRPLVAFHDGARIMLAVCERGRCGITAVARDTASDRPAMTLVGDGRPVIVSLARSPDPDVGWDLATVTVLNLPGPPDS